MYLFITEHYIHLCPMLWVDRVPSNVIDPHTLIPLTAHMCTHTKNTCIHNTPNSSIVFNLELISANSCSLDGIHGYFGVSSADIVSASGRLLLVLCLPLIGGRLVAIETHCTWGFN